MLRHPPGLFAAGHFQQGLTKLSYHRTALITLQLQQRPQSNYRPLFLQRHTIQAQLNQLVNGPDRLGAGDAKVRHSWVELLSRKCILCYRNGFLWGIFPGEYLQNHQAKLVHVASGLGYPGFTVEGVYVDLCAGDS